MTNGINSNDGPAALAKLLLFPLTEPVRLAADFMEIAARGGQRVVYKPSPSIESHPAKFGRNASLGDNLFLF